MPVIINDLEVVIEAPAPSGQQQGATADDQRSAEPVKLTPYDISVLQRQQRDRAERVKAH